MNVTCELDREQRTPLNPGRKPCIIYEFPITDLGREETYNFVVNYARPDEIGMVDFKRTGDVSPKVKFIPAQIFATFPILIIYTQVSDLAELHSGDFDDAINLAQLFLNNNQLTKIKNDVFPSVARRTQSDGSTKYPLHRLIELSLAGNNIADIEPNSFYGLNRLKWLNLQFDQLTTIGRDTFAGLPKLYTLDLTGNKIEMIENGAFDFPELIWIR